MDYKISRLPNGLRVVTSILPNLESATLTIWVKAGSRLETDRIAGISHFLEHMVFKGSQSRPSAREIAEAVDAIGGEFNAATSKEWTNFYIKARSANLPLAFDVLADMVLNPVLKAEEVEREKGVILEEMAMYEDTPIYKIGDVFEELTFSGSTLGRDIIGLKESIKSLSRNDFISYREAHYYADNIVITVSGGVSESDVLSLSRKYFSNLEKGKSKVKYNYNHRQKSPRVKLKKKANEQAHLILGFVGYPRGHQNRFTEAVLSCLLGGGMSSRLFTEIRERRGLAYSVKTSADHFVDTGEFATYAGVDVKKAHEAIKVMLDQYYGLASGQYPISQKELAKAKEFLKGHLALALEDTKEINVLFGENELMLGRIETPDEIYANIDKVSKKEVVKLAGQIFRPEGLNLAIIGPYKDSEPFEKLL
jgi:predicted Zn-dependent peptidase